MKVLILGCGPAGLISAQAAWREFRAEVQIISLPRKSQLYGCQYLHAEIAGVEAPSAMVNYSVHGTAEQYRKKVYGSLRLPAAVSPQLFEGSAPAWDIRYAYDSLWNMFYDNIESGEITPHNIIDVLSQYNPDAAISSIPLQNICQEGERHSFSSVPVYAMGDGPGQTVPVNVAENTVLCNGTDETGWYRAANVFGYKTVEWPGSLRKVPIKGVVKVNKPLGTDCNCLQGILRVGRHGMWQKGVLAHQAYNATARYLGTIR